MADALTPRRFAEWHEDHRDVLWFRSPISEPPYCGSPLDLGRTMTVEISIGREHFEFAPRDTGGWPFEQSAECAAGCDEGVAQDQAYSEILSFAGSALASSYARARTTLEGRGS